MKANKNKKQKNTTHSPLTGLDKKNWSKYVLFGILVLTFIIYLSSLKNNFITGWDDDSYITNNHSIKSLGFENVKDFFTKSFVSCYLPFTVLSYAFEYSLFGQNVVIFHLTNLILHLLNVTLSFLFFKKLTNKIEIAGIIAFIFALHPMHVESVAWVAERKDVLYSFFFLCSLISYLFYKQKNHKYVYLIYSFVCFIFSLLSKPAAVPLPLILLLIDYYFTGKIFIKKRLIEKISFFIFSIIFGVLAIHFQKDTGAVEMAPVYSFFDKIFLISYASVFYIIKFFLPLNLSAVYYFPIKVNGWLPSEYYVAPLIILLLIFGIYKSGIHRKYIMWGILFYLFSIGMVLQFIPLGRAITADRYSYISFLGLAFIIGYYYSFLMKKNMKFKTILSVIGIFYILYFSIHTWNRIQVWKNGITLFTDVSEKFPEQPHVWIMRATLFELENDFESAIRDDTKSLSLKKDGKVYNHRGFMELKINNLNGAISDFQQSIHLDPTFGLAYYNLAEAIEKSTQNYHEEIKYYDLAIKFNKTTSNDFIYNNRGLAKFNLGDYSDAMIDFTQAIQIKPKYAEAYYNRGLAKLFQKRFKESIPDFDVCLRLNPDLLNAFLSRGLAKSELKDSLSACIDFQAAFDRGLPDAIHYIKKYCRKKI